jgi:hypothetical protein
LKQLIFSRDAYTGIIMSKRDIILKRKRVLYIDVLKIKERNKRKK